MERVYKLMSNYKYDNFFFSTRYCPWFSDDKFGKVWEAITYYSLVDHYKAYELWTLVEQAAKLPGDIIEIGIWQGGSAALIAKKAMLVSPEKTVYMCDTFKGVVKCGEHDSYTNGRHADTSIEIVNEILTTLDITNAVILTGIFPEDTGHFVESNQFSLVHIDVDVYQSSKDITDWIWPRLCVGGIIVHDDYGIHGCEGITTHVNEQLLLEDRLVLYNVNGHSIIIKLK